MCCPKEKSLVGMKRGKGGGKEKEKEKRHIISESGQDIITSLKRGDTVDLLETPVPQGLFPTLLFSTPTYLSVLPFTPLSFLLSFPLSLFPPSPHTFVEGYCCFISKKKGKTNSSSCLLR